MKGGRQVGGEGETRLAGFQIPVADVEFKVCFYLFIFFFLSSSFICHNYLYFFFSSLFFRDYQS